MINDEKGGSYDVKSDSRINPTVTMDNIMGEPSPLPPFVPLNHSTVSDKNILSESNDSSEENGDDPVVIF